MATSEKCLLVHLLDRRLLGARTAVTADDAARDEEAYGKEENEASLVRTNGAFTQSQHPTLKYVEVGIQSCMYVHVLLRR